MRRASGLVRAVCGGVAAILLLGLAGCLDLGLAGNAVMAPRVPGLRTDEPWVSLPVGGWVLESGIRPRAVSACFDAACAPRAAVALFDAAGQDAERLARVIDDPGTLAAALASPDRSRTAATSRRAKGPRAVVQVEARRDGTLSGFVVRMARPDGSRPVAGYVLTARRAGTLTVILSIAADEDAARRVAREVATAL